jgi:hypothetical protein
LLAASSQFAAMIDGQDVVCDIRVTLTLPGGVYPDVTLAVESLTIQAQITTDMPQGTRLDVGYPKIDADLTLSGLVDPADETKTAAWLFGPWGTQAADGTVSPLYRAKVLYSPVTIDVGLNPAGSSGTPELLRKFTGYIDEISVSGDGTVTLNCLDNHTKLRALPSTPAIVVAPPGNAGLTSEAVLDSLIYRASNGAVGTRPATRPGCILNAGLRTTIFPDVGYQYGINLEPFYAARNTGSFGGAFGTALYGEANGLGIGFTTVAEAGASFFFEYWLTGAAPLPQRGHAVVVGNAASSNAVTVIVDQNNFSVWAPGNSTATPDYVWPFGSIDTHTHYVGVKWTQTPGSTAWSATLYLDNRTPQTASGTSTAARATGWSTVVIAMSAKYGSETIEALQVSNETSPVPNYPFTPTAVLDASLNALQAIPAYSGDPWDVIQQVADAELGVAGFDEAGIFRFHNRDTLRAGSVVRTLTSATSLMSIGSTLSASELIDRVQVTTQPWTFSNSGLAYHLDKAQKITRKSTQTFTIDLGDVLVGQIGTLEPSVLADGHTPSDGFSYYRASTTKAGTVEASLPVGAVKLQQTDSSHVQVTVRNPYSYDVWLVSPASYLDIPAGTPALWIGGTVATQASGNVADVQWPPVNPDGTGGAAASQAGEVAYTISGNPWVQDDDTGAQLAVDILTDMAVPRPSLTAVEIVPDVRLQLCDRVVISDPDVMNINEPALLFGWQLAWTVEQGLLMTVDARTVAAPGDWILGYTGRTELGTTTLI